MNLLKSKKIWLLTIALAFLLNSISYPTYGMRMLAGESLFKTERKIKQIRDLAGKLAGGKDIKSELHKILEEIKTEDSDLQKESHKRTGKAKEYSRGKEETTYRYGEFFSDRTHIQDWPESSLVKEKILAEWLDRLISLDGKRVIHYRSEYYPFFGIQAAKRNAKVILLDPREIEYVDDVIKGKRFSIADYNKAEEELRQISPLSPIVKKYSEQLLELPPQELIQLIARVKLDIPEKIWRNLTAIEKTYYILDWIKDNPKFALDAAKYFAGENKDFWALSDNERLPYLVDFLQENYLDAITKDVEYTALDLLRERTADSLTDAQRFSYYFYSIYGRLLSEYRIAKMANMGEEYFEDKFNEMVREKLLSPDKATQQKIVSNISYSYGEEISDTNLAENSVDVIYSGYALNHIEDTVKFCQGVGKVLKPGGYFVGYIKAEDSERRTFESPQALRDVLTNIGFSDEDIVIVKYEDEFPTTVPAYPTEYLFFARKGEGFSPQATETTLALASGGENNLVKNVSFDLGIDLEKKEFSEAEKISKTWDRTITLSQLTEKLLSYRTKNLDGYRQTIRSIFTLLFGESYIVDEDTLEEISKERVNIDNLFRYLTVKFRSFPELEKAISNLSQKDELKYLLSDLQQFYLIRKQIELLLVDLTKYFDNVNFLLPTKNIEERILQRANAIGGKKLVKDIQNIFDILTNPAISLKERRRRIYSEQKALYEYFKGYNFFFFVDYEMSPMFYSKHKYGDHPPENKAYEITSSIGEYFNVSIIKFNDNRYYVDKVHRSISATSKEIAGEFLEQEGELGKRYLVYTDSLAEVYKSIKNEYERNRVFGVLVKKQWGSQPNRGVIVDSWIKSITIHEIFHERFPQLGELPSFLAQLAYGPAPFDDLFKNILTLRELNKGEDLAEAVILMLNKEESTSPHYKAARLVVARYLGYILDNAKIDVENLKQRVFNLVRFKDGQYQLNEESAARDSVAIIAAMSYLSEDEVRSIASNWLRDEFNFKLDSSPKELTISLPVFDESFDVKEGKQELVAIGPSDVVLKNVLAPFVKDKQSNLPVSLKGEPFSQIVEEAINEIVEIPNTLAKAEATVDIATTLMDTNVNSAITLIKGSIHQKYQRGKALLQLAKVAEEQGNRKIAISLLREAEGLLGREKELPVGLDKVTPSDVLGHLFFNFDDLISLKSKLGLEAETLDLLNKFEKALLNKDISDLSNERVSLLVKVALEKGKLGQIWNDEILKEESIAMLDEIESVVNKFTSTEARETRLVDIALAKGELARMVEAKKTLDDILREKVTWVNANTHLEAARAKVKLGFKEEGLKDLEDLRMARIERPNQVGIPEDHLYPVIGSVKADLGLIDEAKKDFAAALSEEIQSHRFEDDSWGIINTVKEQIKHKNFLDDARENTQRIRDSKERTDWLIKVALEYDKYGQKQQALETLIEAEKIAENIMDDSARANSILKIVTERKKISPAQEKKVMIDKDSTFIIFRALVDVLKQKVNYTIKLKSLENTIEDALLNNNLPIHKTLVLLDTKSLLKNAGVIDLKEALEILVKDVVLDKVVLYAEDSLSNDILEGLLKDIKTDVEIIPLTKQEVAPDISGEIDEIEEIKLLTNFVDKEKDIALVPEDILCVIKGATKQRDELEELSEEQAIPPIVVFDEQGPYSIAEALNRLIANEEMFIPLSPIETTSDIQKELEKYQETLEVLSGA